MPSGYARSALFCAKRETLWKSLMELSTCCRDMRENSASPLVTCRLLSTDPCSAQRALLCAYRDPSMHIGSARLAAIRRGWI